MPVRHSTFARFTLTWVAVLGVVLTFGAQSPSTQTPPIAIPDALAAQLAADGAANVIVGVRARFVPEGDLAAPADVLSQRQAIQLVLDTVTTRAQASGAVVGHRFETIPYFSARVDAGALAVLAALPEVVSIAPDILQRPSLLQSVPIVNANAAWSAGHTGSGWKIAVIDSGVEKMHSFLTSKVMHEACYSNANGAGVGTTTCPGGVTSSTAMHSGAPCTGVADCDHGTHVAGIAAGANGPSAMNGVAFQANLVAMQVFTVFTGAQCSPSPSPCIAAYTSDINRALEQALVLTGGPTNSGMLAAVNMSLGSGAASANCDTVPENVATKAAIDNLRSRGVATIVASGNNGFVTGVSSPACISTAVSVGSTTDSDIVSSFTNAGGGLPLLLAPGGSGSGQGLSTILSSSTGNTYREKVGTSMAAPHVAGAWAILKQAVPTATVTQVLNALRTTGLPVPDPPSSGTYPRININAARLSLIGSTVGAPGAPGTPEVTGAGNDVTITWTAPVTGGAPASYTVIARYTPGGTPIATLPAGNGLITTVLSAPTGTYHVTVQASNAAGTGPESSGVTFSVPLFTPPPDAPTNFASMVSGSNVAFSWTPPAAGSPVTGYLIVAAMTPGGTPIAVLPFNVPPAPGALVTNVPPGTYYVKLAATNPGGSSPFSDEITVVVAGPQVPGMPWLNDATVTGNLVGLSWTAGISGGTATSYLIVAASTPGGPAIATLPVPASPTSYSVSAPAGTYYVRIYGVNAVGTGTPSNEITVVVP